MSKRGARVPAFSKLGYIGSGFKRWYKSYTARRNRKKLHQSKDIETFQDKPLDSWDID